jgi:tetratricopeptide (TPR) repeat protein
LSISTDDLVFALVAAETRRVELASELAEFHLVPAFAPADLLASGVAPLLSPLDWRILDRVDGVRDVAELAAVLDEPLEEIAERVQSLQAAAILELQAARNNPAVAARMALEAGRYEEAAQLLRDRLAAHPHDAEAWRALGLAEVGAGRFENAIDAWQSWRSDEPSRSDEAQALMQAARTMVEALRDARD